MAGQSKTNIETKPHPRQTVIHYEVVGGGKGKIRITIGNQAYDERFLLGKNTFSASYDGVAIIITNTGQQTVKISVDK